MKYKILTAVVLFSAGAILWSTGNFAFGNGAGAPAGVTGSPSDGFTCNTSGCHTGSATTAVTGWITSNIPVGGYTPGSTYTITATATFAGRNKFGFEISPQDPSGNLLGTLVNTSSQTQVTSTKYITHTISGTAGTGSKTWTFNWVAPASGTGDVTFYGAFNCANGDNSNSGDLIYTSSLTVPEAPTPGDDAGIFAISYPSDFACDPTLTPLVTLRNFGTTTLTSATINYFIDANTPSAFSWSGSLATGASEQVTLPSLTVAAGAHTFTASTSNPNGAPDALTNNDSKSTSFVTTFTSSSMPFAEGFESTTFPPAGWKLDNPDNSTTWVRTTAAASSGSASAFMDNYNYNAHGQQDILFTPPVDLTTSASPALTFEVAYKLYTNPSFTPNFSDTLSVFISTDCGTTWSQIYKKYGSALATGTPVYQTSAFTPTTAQWRMETVDLSTYATCNNAIVKFVNTNSYENNLYIDDVNISGGLGIVPATDNRTSLRLYPNPVASQVSLRYFLPHRSSVSAKIYGIDGKVAGNVFSVTDQPAGIYNMNFDVSSLAPGMYFFCLTDGKNTITRKFVVQR